MKLDVICFGALNLDKLFRVNRIAKEDEEGTILSFEEHPGGSAANTAVGLSRLGLKVGYIGKVARDREGEILLKDFMKEKVDSSGIVISSRGRSGVVYGFVDIKGNRALYVDPGVNDELETSEVNLSYASSADFIHLTSFVGDKSFKTQIEILKALPEKVRVSLDPGNLYARKGMDALSEMLSRCYIVMPNEFELKLLTGKDRVKEGAETLLSKGASIVAVKLGSKGCYVTNGIESHFIDVFKVDVVDTTGAGDAFCAGFLYGIIKGMGIEESGKIGNFVASRCIMKVGARLGLPTMEELELMETL